MFTLSSFLFTLVSLLASLGLAQQTFTVQAGGNGELNFAPSSLVAPIGSQVQFVWYPRNHSLASSSYDNACQPDGRIFSGYFSVNSGASVSIPSFWSMAEMMEYADDDGQGTPSTFVITITDNNPIWYYCTQVAYTHCQNGMVGVINPPASGPQTYAGYLAASRAATARPAGDLPAIIGGQVVGPPASSSSSSYVATRGVTVLVLSQSSSATPSASTPSAPVFSATSTSSVSFAYAPTTLPTSSVTSVMAMSVASSSTSAAGGGVITVTTTRSACPVTTAGSRIMRREI
ncbi:hypothetical protein B0A48_13761 [Cryoendolithus antarcticus]|uniref:Extracellular serine-rich protein n=1 Tax=Cryoendolithus antarcticus TaxID=1507870 RepID=A0A1V8SNF4_9PEZI|nr:hypothetical protein B0A48_13761 [Cryoendolithus antarcticus]